MMTKPAIPQVVYVYGLLGLVPFLLPPLAGLIIPDSRETMASVLALYGALILSFLGGARWGMAVGRLAPSAGIVSISMLPALAGLALLLVPSRHVQFLGLAAALAAVWVWDMGADDLPDWYGSLRSVLTAGAVAGLLLGALILA
jgi:hypothetical protein